MGPLVRQAPLILSSKIRPFLGVQLHQAHNGFTIRFYVSPSILPSVSETHRFLAASNIQKSP